mmetsp:Transcript_18251/g.45348  ORF Transcript_18251/g.45348 Transcript_18251/m.45348 type:complete len:227 (-) Transcript_18251:1121-1801(-)
MGEANPVFLDVKNVRIDVLVIEGILVVFGRFSKPHQCLLQFSQKIKDDSKLCLDVGALEQWLVRKWFVQTLQQYQRIFVGTMVVCHEVTAKEMIHVVSCKRRLECLLHLLLNVGGGCPVVSASGSALLEELLVVIGSGSAHQDFAEIKPGAPVEGKFQETLNKNHVRRMGAGNRFLLGLLEQHSVNIQSKSIQFVCLWIAFVVLVGILVSCFLALFRSKGIVLVGL